VSRRDRLVREHLRERFVATLRGGEAFEGLLLEVDDLTYRFADAFAVDDKSRVRVDGELFLPRQEVIYLQRPGVIA
jgi:hypothetical protein